MKVTGDWGTGDGVGKRQGAIGKGQKAPGNRGIMPCSPVASGYSLIPKSVMNRKSFILPC